MYWREKYFPCILSSLILILAFRMAFHIRYSCQVGRVLVIQTFNLFTGDIILEGCIEKFRYFFLFHFHFLILPKFTRRRRSCEAFYFFDYRRQFLFSLRVKKSRKIIITVCLVHSVVTGVFCFRRQI